MAWKELKETVGLLALIAGLMFVGVEIRQNNQLARGQARQALADGNQDWLLYLAQDSATFAIYDKVWSSDSEVTHGELQRARLMMIAGLRRAENVYLQFGEGLVDKSALDAYGIHMLRRQAATSRFESFWVDDDFRSTFDAGFVEFFEDTGG
jgi:hypothetical protein